MRASPAQVTLEEGIASHEHGDMAGAADVYSRILEQRPDDPDALHLLGLLRLDAGAADQAEELIRRALDFSPGNAVMLNSLGTVLERRGLQDDAMACYRQAVDTDDELADAWFNIGRLQHRMGDMDAAVDSLERMTVLVPDDLPALVALGGLYLRQANDTAAAKAFQSVLEMDPDHTEANWHAGCLAQRAGEIDRALNHFERVLKRDPGHAGAAVRIAVILSDRGRNRAALKRLEDVAGCGIAPPALWDAMGRVRRRLGQVTAAIGCFRRAVDAEPERAAAWNNMGNALKDAGRLPEALTAFETAVDLAPGFAAARSNLIFALNYLPIPDPVRRDDALKAWWQAIGAAVSGQGGHDVTPDPHRKLRVGYVSPDFCNHAVSRFFLPLIHHHDRTRVSVTCYAESRRTDETTDAIRKLADGWVDTRGMDDTALADRIADDRIDILVDLAGHTAHNRLPVFARKPAPVQVSWLGYPGRTGLPAMDYRIVDDETDPATGDADGGRETPVRLPGGFLCYAPPAAAPDPSDPPVMGAGHVTFGSFNNLAKANDEVVALWSRILTRVPGARLLLKSYQLADAECRERLLAGFRRRGIDDDRITLLDYVTDYGGHMACYNQMDIALDTFPYNGTTTTCDALWMGVPVVTLTGTVHRSRVGRSLLARVGRTDWAADSADAYVRKAVALAADRSGLRAIRRSLRGVMAVSRLCDGARLAAEMEAAFTGIWAHWCDQQTAPAGDAPRSEGADAPLSRAAIQARVKQFPYWYHKIPLPRGVVTPGWAPLAPDAYGLPADLSGKRVLDVGAWDGYWTFEALRRGAREVVAIDDFSDFLGTLSDPDRKAWETFDLCRELLGHAPDVCRRRELSVYDVTEAILGRFDVVFCFGALYHLRYPLLALDRLAAVCDGEIFVESAILDDFSPYRGGLGKGCPGEMVMEFYPGREYANNDSNWWVPSLRCMEQMVRAAGFSRTRAWKLSAAPQNLAHCRGFVHGGKAHP